MTNLTQHLHDGRVVYVRYNDRIDGDLFRQGFIVDGMRPMVFGDLYDCSHVAKLHRTVGLLEKAYWI